jgi:hypothetical protein
MIDPVSAANTSAFVLREVDEAREITNQIAPMTPQQKTIFMDSMKAIENAVHTPVQHRTPEQMKVAARYEAYLAETIVDGNLFARKQ